MYAKWLAIGIVREIANLKKKTQITDESIKSLVKTIISMSLDSMEFTRAQGSDNAFILTPSTMQKLASGKSETGDVFAKAYEQQNKLKLTDLEHNDLARRFTIAFLQISNIEQERMKGNYMNPYDAQKLSDSSMPPTVTKKAGMPLSELIERYIDESKLGWTPATLEDFKHTLEVFAWMLNELGYGDIDISAITQDVMRDFKDTYRKIPKNLQHRSNCKGKSLKAILALKIDDPLSPVTCNKHFQTIGGMFIYAQKQGWIERNYAEGLMIKNAQKASVPRAEYKPEQIRQIITQICIAKYKNKPENLWIPVIAAYTGMRLGEICQLRENDIICKDDIWHFSVNTNEGKTLKTESSTRRVPIHPQLIEAGFLVWIQEQKIGQAIFPAITRQAPKFNRWQKWYAYLNKKLFPDSTVVFHSFRHSFVNELKQTGIQDQQISELVGHKTGNITMERYGKNYNLKVLSETIAKLDYGFKLTDLFTYAGKKAIAIK